MLKKLLFLLLFSVFAFNCISQITLSWSGYTNSGYTPYTYTTGIMNAVVTPNVPGSAACTQSVGSNAGSKFFADPTVNGTFPYSPRYITASGSGDYNETGLLLAVDWPGLTSNVTTNITFTQPIIGPISFKIFDINTDGGSFPFSDVVVVSAVNCAGATVYPTVSGVQPNNSYIAANGTIASTTPTSSGGNTMSDVTYTFAAGTGLNSLQIIYKSNSTITNTGSGCAGNNNGADPYYEYIVISNITAYTITTSISASAMPCGSTTTTLTCTTNATSPTYSWTGTTGTTIVSPTSASTSVSGAGTYTVMVTDNGGCTSTASYTVTSGGSAPTITANPANPTICSGSSVTLNAGGGLTYAWSPAGGLSATTGTTVIANPTTNTNYIVTGTDGSGCTNTASVTVNVNPVPTASAGSDQTICAGQSASLIATGGGTYVWSNGGIVAGNTVAPASTSTYTVTVTNGGCTASASVNVNVNPTPTANAGADQNICTGQSATLTVTGVGTYLWSDGTTNATTTVTPASTETFTVTVTNGGCSTTDDVIVNVNATIPASAGPDQNICTGQSATLIATGGTSYSWNNTATNDTIVVTPASTTSYTVTVSSGGCSGVDTIIVNVGNNAVILVTPANPSICPGSSILLTASGGNTYTWSPAAGLSDTTGTSVTASPSATTTYTVNGSNGTGCTGSTSITVTVAPIVATTTFTNESCGLSNGTATVNTTGTCTNGFTYLWDTPTQQTQQTVTNLAAGTYNVTVTCGTCTATASVNITNTPGLTVTTDSIVNEECNLMNGSATAVVSGGSAPYQYSWNSTPVQNTAILTNVPAGTYTVTVTDNNGCTNTAIATLGLISGPAIAITTSNETCSQNNGSLSASASNGSGNYTYTWSTNPSQTTPTITNLAAGIYTVTVTDGTCTSTASVTINNMEAPVAIINANPHVVSTLNDSVTFTSESTGTIVGWLWTYGDGSSGSGSATTHGYAQSGTYIISLLVTDNNGCTSIAYDTIIVNDIYTVYIPSAFSPTGDGMNDYFFPVCSGIDPSDFQFLVINRWGNIVFETTTYGDKWNGTKFNQGNPTVDCINEVYVYRITVKPFGAGEQSYIGRVTLVN